MFTAQPYLFPEERKQNWGEVVENRGEIAVQACQKLAQFSLPATFTNVLIELIALCSGRITLKIE